MDVLGELLAQIASLKESASSPAACAICKTLVLRRSVAPMQAGGAVEGELSSLQEQVDKVAAEVRGRRALIQACWGNVGR